MKNFLYVISMFALILPFSLTANATADSISPQTGDIAIPVSIVLIVICVAVFIFIKRRRG